VFTVKGYKLSWKTECIAGITTFLTMAYIMVVNPLVLSAAKVPFAQAFTATIIATVIGTLIMALFANYPIAIAPGMGLNAYFTYSVVQAQKLTYQVAFSAVFIAAILFVLLSLTPLRTKLIGAIPINLRHAIAAGIGLFIAFIGLRLTGLVQSQSDNLVALGNLLTPTALLTLTGLVITTILMARRVYGALFIGMVITGILALLAGQLTLKGVVSLPTLPVGLVVYNPVTAIGDIIHYGLYAAIFSFLLVTLFDTTGTVLGVAEQAGLMEDDKLPRAEQALLADSLATLIGSIFGTSPTSAYIESTAGVAVGGRTGLTALVVAILFTISAFFYPIISAIASEAAITGPALIIVGALMASNVRYINWDQFDEAFPAFLVILSMPLTSSIATGIALGFIFFPILKLVTGQGGKVHPLVYIFGVLFLFNLIVLPH
jgi:AGZA family xanthine/uracil permease-like MFS transporter